MTTIVTIAKATPSVLSTACGIKVESTTKGVPGQFDKLSALITNHLQEGEFAIEAGKIKGVFKALNEYSKDCTTFKFVLACNEWGLEPKDNNSWVILRPQGNISLINGSYVEPTQQPKEVEMEVIEDSFNFKSLTFGEKSNINCLIAQIGGKTFPESLNDIEDSILNASWNEDEKIQLAIRELEVLVREYRPSQIKEKAKTYPVIVYTGEIELPTVICLGYIQDEVMVEDYFHEYIPTRWEQVVADELGQQEPTAIKQEESAVSVATQTEAKPKTFCQMLREEWLPSRETWVIDSLKRKMRATWKARKDITCPRQAAFMAEFFRRLDVYSPNTELPLQAFLTTYDLVREGMTGQKTQTTKPEMVRKDHNTDEVKDAYTNHLNNLLSQFPERVVKEVQPSEDEELSEGNVVIHTFGNKNYTIEVFFNKDKTLWINTKSGKYFNSLYDLCMVEEKEYKDHQLFINNQPVGGIQ